MSRRSWSVLLYVLPCPTRHTAARIGLVQDEFGACTSAREALGLGSRGVAWAGMRNRILECGIVTWAVSIVAVALLRGDGTRTRASWRLSHRRRRGTDDRTGPNGTQTRRRTRRDNVRKASRNKARKRPRAGQSLAARQTPQPPTRRRAGKKWVRGPGFSASGLTRVRTRVGWVDPGGPD